jgi:metal-responsive CopG/Arc/MetJ family transcriptional regulator
MKTAVSIPDKVFKKAEATAKRLKMSRSELYSRAIDAWVDAHSPDAITEAMNAALDQLTAEEKEAELAFVRAAAAHTLTRNPW